MSETPDKSSQIVPAAQGDYKVGPGKPPLETRFKKGQSGNPAGPQTAGTCVRSWMNAMGGWSLAKLERVMIDPKSSANKALAAGIWKDALLGRGDDFDRIMDQTIGKPKQAVDMRMAATMTQGDAVHAAMEKLMSDPEAFAAAETIAKRLESDV